MKKQATILFTIIYIATSSFSQNTENKKQKFCSVRLMKMNGPEEKFILGGFLKDSIWGYSFADGSTKKLIIPGNPLFVNRSVIKKVFIKIEKGVLIPVKMNDSVDIKKFRSSLHSLMNTTDFIGLYGSDAGTFSYPELGLVFLAFDLLLPPKGRWYTIKGNEKRFIKMTKDFVRK